MGSKPAAHSLNQTGIILLMVAVCVLVTPSAGFAWTSAGPWGGVIHDLANAPAAGDTLYAGTGNGLYRHNASAGGAWDTFDHTLGYRVLQILPDIDNDKIYAIVRESDDEFDIDEVMWSGELYELDLSTGNFSSIFDTLVSSMTFCGGGDLLISTFDEEWYNIPNWETEGYVYRRSGGSGWTRILPYDYNYYPYLTDVDRNEPIQALLGRAGTDTVYMVRRWGSQTDTLVSTSQGACGSTWYMDLGAGSTPITTLDYGPSDEILLGTADGDVMARASTNNWPVLGSGLPTYPVVRFIDMGPAGPAVILRETNYNWNLTNSTDPRGGIYTFQTGTWVHVGSSGNTAYDYVSNRVSDVIPLAGDLWIAYDDAGIWRYAGGILPAQECDEGIAAVNLSGITIDPRNTDRALAYGPSGIYERRDGVWRRLVMDFFGTIINLEDNFGDTVQSIRERGFQSAALSYDDPGVIWVGGMNVAGLLKGRRTSSGSWDYIFDQIYWKSAGNNSRVTDILVDPYDSDRVWFSTWSREGMYETTDGGVNYHSITAHLDSTDTVSYMINDLETDYLDPASRTLLAAKNTDTTFGESGLLVCEGAGQFEESGLYTDQVVGAIAVNPQDLGQKKAVVGPGNTLEGMAVLSTTIGTWSIDTTVGAPMGLPSARNFTDLTIPLGYDADDIPNAFSVVNENGTEYWGLYQSAADTAQGSPGHTWVEHPDLWEIEAYRPNSVTVDPKDGNLLWVTTQIGSAFTWRGSHFSDLAEPWWPGFTGDLAVDSSSTGDTLKVDPASIAADTAHAGSTVQLVRMDLTVTNTIDLSWAAPGDDGTMPGWADRYELYYTSAAPIADSSDLSGAYTANMPVPHIAHRQESYSLNVSSHLDSWYWIALVSFDDENRASLIQTVSTGFAWDSGDTALTGVSMVLTGDIDSLSAVHVYRDTNGSGELEIPGDSQIGSTTAVVSSMAIPVSRTVIDDSLKTILLACDISSAAVTGDSVSVSVTGLTIDAQDSVSGLPAHSGTVALFGSGGSTGGGGGGGGGGCFIATAAYGSVLEPEVGLLRDYRDRYLLRRAWGRSLVDTYYSLSPGPARFIARYPVLRTAARGLLYPMVTAIKITEQHGVMPVAAGFIAMLLPVAGAGTIVVLFAPGLRRRATSMLLTRRGQTGKLNFPTRKI